MANNGQQPAMPANPLAQIANVLNTMAPHNVLRQMMAGGQLPQLPLPGMAAAPSAAPAAEEKPAPAAPAPGFPEGLGVRWAKRRGETMAQYETYLADRKRKSEIAGYSVEGRTLIF